VPPLPPCLRRLSRQHFYWKPLPTLPLLSPWLLVAAVLLEVLPSLLNSVEEAVLRPPLLKMVAVLSPVAELTLKSVGDLKELLAFLHVLNCEVNLNLVLN